MGRLGISEIDATLVVAPGETSKPGYKIYLYIYIYTSVKIIFENIKNRNH